MPTNTTPANNSNQEELWQRVLSRRLKQLSSFNLHQLRHVSNMAIPDPTAISTAGTNTGLPKKPVNRNDNTKSEYLQFIQDLLEGHFRVSINVSIEPLIRNKSLTCVKDLLSGIDDQHSRGVGKALLSQQERRKKVREEENSRLNKEKGGSSSNNKGGVSTPSDPSEHSSPTLGTRSAAVVSSSATPKNPSATGVVRTDSGTGRNRVCANPSFPARNQTQSQSSTSIDGTSLSTAKSNTGSKSSVTILNSRGVPTSSPSLTNNSDTNRRNNNSNATASNSGGGGLVGSFSQVDPVTGKTTKVCIDSGGYITTTTTAANNSSEGNSNRVDNSLQIANSVVQTLRSTRSTRAQNIDWNNSTKNSTKNNSNMGIISSKQPHTTPKTKVISKPQAQAPPTPAPFPLPKETIASIELLSESALPAPFSSALTARPSCRAQYKSFQFLPQRYNEHVSINKRFERWDPFWKCIHDVTDFLPSPRGGNRIRNQRNAKKEDNYFLFTTNEITNVKEHYSIASHKEHYPQSLLTLQFCIPFSYKSEKGLDKLPVSWGIKQNSTNPPRDGERRLMCRMLPMTPPPADYKSDTHLWPKGTFLTVNGERVQLVQRKQQSHDAKLWKGMCNPLDLTSIISDPTKPNTLTLCTREKDAPYAIQIAICEYNSPKMLLEQTISQSIIPFTQTSRKIPYEDAVDIAKRYVGLQTIVLDDSDSEDDDAKGVPVTFQLTCPIGMKPMEVPVRGTNCKHVQCVDLFTFLHYNSFPSGRRWRCPSCDDFVSLNDLVICGLFERMCDKHKQEAGEGRDKVTFWADGSWSLVENKKKRMMGGENEIRGAKKKKIEIILL